MYQSAAHKTADSCHQYSSPTAPRYRAPPPNLLLPCSPVPLFAPYPPRPVARSPLRPLPPPPPTTPAAHSATATLASQSHNPPRAAATAVAGTPPAPPRSPH